MYSDLTVLLIDDNASPVADVRSLLAQSAFRDARIVQKDTVDDEEFFFRGLNAVAVVLFGLEVASAKGQEKLRKMIVTYPESSIIVLSDGYDSKLALQILEVGAHNFLDRNKLTLKILSQAMRFPMERNHNVMKLQKAFSSLKISEHQLAKLFDNHLMALTVSTLEGKFVQVNEVFLYFLGRTEEEVIGKTARELDFWVVPDQREDYIRRLLAGEEIKNREIEIRTKEGRVVPMYFSIDLIDTDAGIMVLTTGQDRTDHLEAVKRLGESRKHLDTLINSSSKPMWLVDHNLCLVTGNLAFKDFAKVYGANLEPGQPVLSAASDESTRKKWEALYARAMKGERFTITNQSVTHGGEVFYNELTLNPAYGEQGQIIGVACFLSDVTELKRVNEQLKESEVRYRSLVENASDAIFIADAKGDYLDVNIQACALTGYAKEELLTMGSYDLVVEEPRGETIEALLEKLRSGHSQIRKLNIRHKDSRLIPIESSSFMLPDGRLVGFARDLTDRMRREKEETEMQKRLKAIVDGTTDAILLADSEGRYVQVNPAAAKMLGYTEEELLLKKSHEVVAGGSQALWENFIKRGHQAGTIELYRKDGLKIICHYNATANILPGLHLSILTDITERKRAESLIRESEARLAEAQRLARFGYWERNLATNELTWSDELYRIFQNEKSDDPFTFDEFLAFVVKSEREYVRETIEKIKSQRTPASIEYSIITPRGERRIIQNSIYLDHDPSGKLTKLFGTAQDITAQKQSENRVRESEKRYRYLFEHNPLPMWVLDTDTLLFLDVNQAALEHYQYSREEFLALPYQSIKSAGEKKHISDFKELISAKPLNAGFWKHQKKDSSVIDVELLFHAIDYPQKNACLAIVNDVTEKLRVEAEIKSSYQQLQELTGHLQHVIEEERTRISREVHDELGQLLTGLKMDASWILKKLAPDDAGVRNKVSEMIALIDETVKSVRRISSELRPGILDDLGLAAALEWLGQEFEKRTGIACSFDNRAAGFEPEGALASNIFRIYQEALTNVARHAQAKKITTTLEKKEGNLYLKIKDDGIGFDPLASSQNGKTLGLIGMKERALMFQGSLLVQSQDKVGTTVTLCIPTTQGKATHEIFNRR